MPISATDECSEAHWLEVKHIIYDAIIEAGFQPNLVSDDDSSGVIQQRIVQNLYDNPIVVCDVSCKNPNVMFELGMRLAFDKPTIVIKDDQTSYSFDTAPIEHLSYPRDLRFNKIVDFKKLLTAKIMATYEKSNNDPNNSTFLKHFGKFTIKELENKEVSKDEYIINELKELRKAVNHLARDHASIDPTIRMGVKALLNKNEKNKNSALKSEMENMIKIIAQQCIFESHKNNLDSNKLKDHILRKAVDYLDSNGNWDILSTNEIIRIVDDELSVHHQ